MERFEKFINTRRGQVIWYFLIILISISSQSAEIKSVWDLAIWLSTALMAWFGITYSNAKITHLKTWRIFAILLPFPTYTFFLIRHVYNVSLKKTFLLTGSIFILIVSLMLFYQIANFYDINSSIIDLHKKAQTNDSKINPIYEKLTNQSSPDKEPYKETMQINQEQSLILRNLVKKINELESSPITKSFPELNIRVSAQKNQYEQHLEEIEANIKWNKEVLKDNPNKVRLNELLEKSDIENKKTGKTLEEVNKLGSSPSFLNIIFSHSWSLSIILLSGMLTLVLAVLSTISIVKGIKKKAFISIETLVTLINLVSVVTLVLTFLFILIL